MRDLIVFFLICFLISCSDTTSSSEDNQDEKHQYATILTPIPSDSLNILQAEFDSLNNNRIVTILNQYGLTGSEDRYHPWELNIISENQALHLAKEALLLNSKFTNVSDSSALFLRGTNKFDEGNRWKIVFEAQVYNSYKVVYSEINVWVHGGETYRIAGFWFSSINIPLVDNISPDVAKESIVGEQITYYSSSGTPVIFTVAEESIIDSTEKVIFPYKNNDNLELRVVWKIGIKLDEFDDFNAWDLYLDTSTGEIVAIVQNFRT